MHHDDSTETRFIGLFYGLIALFLTLAIFAALAGAHLLSLGALIVPMFLAMGLLWIGSPHE